MEMKRLLTLVLGMLLTLTGVMQAQRNGGGRRNGGGDIPEGMRKAKVGRLYGTVRDAESREPIPYASVALLNGKDSIVAGVLTKENGDFNLEGLGLGRYRLKIKSLGFKEYLLPVSLRPPENVEQDLGYIALEAAATDLKTAEVRGRKGTLVMGIDRKIFNVEKNIHSDGGTAEDIMKVVPSVTLDADGNAQLRNNAAAIYIDGKPTTLALNQIPANQIETVEIITNPSAKFDASTTGGILNLTMKKNRQPGYNGSVNLNAGTGNHYNANGNLNIKEYPFNLALNYNFNAVDQLSNGYTYQTDFRRGVINDYYNTTNLPENNRRFNSGRFALDYNLNNRNVLTLSSHVSLGQFNTDDNQQFAYLSPLRDTSYYGTRVSNGNSHFNNITGELAWKRTYPKKGKELSASVQFNYSDNANMGYYETNDYLRDGVALVQPQLKQTIGMGHSDQYIIQMDYTNPITDSAKIEFGVRSFIKNTLSLFEADTFEYSNAQYMLDAPLTSNYSINSMVNAAYFIYAGRYKGWGYQAGVRFEDSYLKGVTTPNETQAFSYQYPSGSGDLLKAFFPSLYLTKKLGEDEELQFNFSRKIHRPDFREILPYTTFVNDRSYQRGNPGLKPEFLNLAEINYNKLLGEHSLIVGLYVRHTDQAITSLSNPLDSNANILLTTYVNGASKTVYGVDNTLKLQLGKGVEWMTSMNLFDTDIATDSLRNHGWSINLKTNFNIKLPKGFTAQVSGSYESRRISLQGYSLPLAFADLSFKKEFSKNVSMTLSVNDLFNSRRHESILNTAYYYQDVMRRREVRYLKVGFQMRFGKTDVSIFRRKKVKEAQPDETEQQVMDN